MTHPSKYLTAALATALSFTSHAASVIPGIPDTSPAPTTSHVAKPAVSDSTQINRLAGQYANWAGSNTNAVNLVNGLRHGSTITLVPGSLAAQTPSATFSPTTKPMGWGNVTKALSLAQKDLAARGITNPTPQQLQAALTGGDITPITSTQTSHMDGILTMRSQGMGWGQVAHNLNLKPGAAFKPTSPSTRAQNSRHDAIDDNQNPDLIDANDHHEHLLSNNRTTSLDRITTAQGQTVHGSAAQIHGQSANPTHSTHMPISRVVSASGAPMATSSVYQHTQGNGHIGGNYSNHITTASGGNISAGLGNAGGSQGKALGHGKN